MVFFFLWKSSILTNLSLDVFSFFLSFAFEKDGRVNVSIFSSTVLLFKMRNQYSKRHNNNVTTPELTRLPPLSSKTYSIIFIIPITLFLDIISFLRFYQENRKSWIVTITCILSHKSLVTPKKCVCNQCRKHIYLLYKPPSFPPAFELCLIFFLITISFFYQYTL